MSASNSAHLGHQMLPVQEPETESDREEDEEDGGLSGQAAKGNHPQAFAKLLSSDLEFYLHTTILKFGRETELTQSSPSVPFTNNQHAIAPHTASFIGVSKEKNISRDHAEIRWNTRQRGWEIECHSKNGVIVNESQLFPGQPPLPLQHRSRIQIGSKIYFFLLPTIS